MIIRACQACYKKKLKCERSSPTLECRRCITANIPCVSRSENTKIQVSKKEYTMQKEQIENLKQELLAKESEIDSLKIELHNYKKEEERKNTSRVNVNESIINNSLESLLSKNILQNTLEPIEEISTSTSKFSESIKCYLFGEKYKTSAHSFRRDKISGCFEFVKRSNVYQYNLPEKTRAYTLIGAAYNKLCYDYHFIVRSEIFETVDEIYQCNEVYPKRIEVVRFYLLLTLGEYFSPSNANNNIYEFPGLEYFTVSMRLLEDNHEHPTLEYIEVLLLFCVYLNNLNLPNYSYVYMGVASRLAIAMGLNKKSTYNSQNLETVQMERMKRVWWTKYILETSLSFCLGYSVDIFQDYKIPLPTDTQVFDITSNSEFSPCFFLLKRIDIALIYAKINKCIYRSFDNVQGLVKSTTACLQSCNMFYDNLLDECKAVHKKSVTLFNVSSLKLKIRFNECILHATKPLFLFFLKLFLKGSNNTVNLSFVNESRISKFSETCFIAALNNCSILSAHFEKNRSILFGYFDTYSLFTAAAIALAGIQVDNFRSSFMSNEGKDPKDIVEKSINQLGEMQSQGNLCVPELFEKLRTMQDDFDKFQSELSGIGVNSLINNVDSSEQLKVLLENDWKFIEESNNFSSYNFQSFTEDFDFSQL